MTSSPASAPQQIRTNNLALAFQEVFTVILRTRFFVQRVENADSFRATLRKMISAAVKDSSAIGYSDEASKMAIYAMIGFLDESILNSKDPTFADWARRPLQEEMFGGHFAGEYFFRNVNDLLNRPESDAGWNESPTRHRRRNVRGSRAAGSAHATRAHRQPRRIRGD